MKLSECKLGEVVVDSHNGKIGHVVGLHRQYMFESDAKRGEVIPEILFAGDKRPVAIHHKNLSKYKD